MVKTLAFHGVIESAPPQDVFKFLYEDDAFTKRYHQQVNDDPNASATEWSEDGIREVTFRPSFSLPWYLSNLVGVNMPQVKEIQKYSKSDSVFTIHSKLSINLVGATAVFSGDTILSPDGEGRCAVNVNLTLDVRSAMQGWVESYMEREAEASFKTWMNIARVFCEEKMDLAKGSLLNHDFYDINGTALDNMPPPAKVGQVPHISSSRPTESVSWPQVLSHLRRLDEKVLKLERDLLLLRSSLKSQMSKAWSIYGLGTATGLALCFLYLLKREKRT